MLTCFSNYFVRWLAFHSFCKIPSHFFLSVHCKYKTTMHLTFMNENIPQVNAPLLSNSSTIIIIIIIIYYRKIKPTETCVLCCKILVVTGHTQLTSISYMLIIIAIILCYLRANISFINQIDRFELVSRDHSTAICSDLLYPRFHSGICPKSYGR